MSPIRRKALLTETERLIAEGFMMRKHFPSLKSQIAQDAWDDLIDCFKILTEEDWV